MTSGIVSLNPSVELSDFFDFLWETDEGFVYAPTKNPASTEWTSHFFQWPKQKKELMEHVITSTTNLEVYIAPAMFNAETATKAHFKSSRVLWSEIDGSPLPPGVWEEIPHPSRRIQSSNEYHEHFYWKLDAPITDSRELEQLTRGLTYFLGADSSGWDCTQILRPPSTRNHKRDKLVTTLTTNAKVFTLNDFATVPVPKQLVRESIDLADIPDLPTVIAMHSWASDDFNFFRRSDIPQGSRSSAMMRLGFICAEMRMTDEEAYAVLFNADERWGKFKNRSDRPRRLLDIINRARLKYPIDPEDETPETLQLYGWNDFMSLELHVDWIIEGILQRQGVCMLSGPPNVGKTQVSLQFGISMALGRNFLDWKIDVPRKIIFFSMEMGPADLKFFMQQMNDKLSLEDRELLQQNFIIVPLGHGLLFDSPVDQAKIEKYVSAVQPDGIIIDSLSVTTEEGLNDEKIAKGIMNYVTKIKQQFDMFVWFIHHNRKAQVNNKKPNKLDDLYGSQHFTRQATTVIGLWGNKSGEIEVSCLKVRLSKHFDEFKIRRTQEGLNFYKSDEQVVTGVLQLGAKKEEDKKDDTPKPAKPTANIGLV